MRTLRLVVAYDGTEFIGWQRQRPRDLAADGTTPAVPAKRSVQETLEDALWRLTGEPIAVAAAGRTDAGVHAYGQVVSFVTHATLPLRAWVHGTNAHLPSTVAVQQAEEADPAFHARFSAQGKHYRYRIWNAPTPSPLLRHTHWHLRLPLDVTAMQEAGAGLLGMHDFRAFRASDCNRIHTVRTLTRVDVSAQPQFQGREICIDVEGTAFLKNMVRIITGTLVEVGQHKRTAASIQELLHTGDRTQAGLTAPAKGLALCEVFYADKPLSGRET